MAWYDFIVGDNPDDVALPAEMVEAQRRRQGLAQTLEREASGTVMTAGERAAQIAGQQAAEQLASQQQSQAASARGLAALSAQRQAMANTAVGQAQIAGNVAEAAARERGAGTQAARAGLMSLLTQQEQAELMADELRRRNARPGLLGVLGGLGGAIIGGYAGGPQGAVAGYSAGQGAGQGLGATFR